MDEAVLVKEEVYLEGLFPMLRRTPNCLFLVSTQMRMSFLTMLKGANMGKVDYIEVSEKCSACRQKKSITECTHMRGYQSSTFSESRKDILLELYRLCRKEDIANQELFSVIDEDTKLRFHVDDVERFIFGDEDDLEAVRIIPNSPIVVGMDLSGAGESDQVYSAFGFDANRRPVVDFFFFLSHSHFSLFVRGNSFFFLSFWAAPGHRPL